MLSRGCTGKNPTSIFEGYGLENFNYSRGVGSLLMRNFWRGRSLPSLFHPTPRLPASPGKWSPVRIRGSLAAIETPSWPNWRRWGSPQNPSSRSLGPLGLLGPRDRRAHPVHRARALPRRIQLKTSVAAASQVPPHRSHRTKKEGSRAWWSLSADYPTPCDGKHWKICKILFRSLYLSLLACCWWLESKD